MGSFEIAARCITASMPFKIARCTSGHPFQFLFGGVDGYHSQLSKRFRSQPRRESLLAQRFDEVGIDVAAMSVTKISRFSPISRYWSGRSNHRTRAGSAVRARWLSLEVGESRLFPQACRVSFRHTYHERSKNRDRQAAEKRQKYRRNLESSKQSRELSWNTPSRLNPGKI